MANTVSHNHDADDALIALIAHEQKGLRRILLSGLIVLVLVVAVSVGLAFYYSKFTRDLAENTQRLDQQAFSLRIKMDRQLNAAADQDAAIRRAYEEIRAANPSGLSNTAPDMAIDAAATYLRWGEVSLAAERLIETARTNGANADTELLLAGVSQLIAWQRLGGRIEKDDVGLPAELMSAKTSFEQLISHPTLASLANTGLGRIYFELASSPRSNFSLADCQSVFNAIGASQTDNAANPLPLYWQAQCKRKLGRNEAALEAYARSLSLTRAAMDTSQSHNPLLRDSSLYELLLNAYHGLGTVSIRPIDTTKSASLAEAMAAALTACDADMIEMGSNQTRLAHACLNKAIDMRESLGQTENQRNGTRENISFVYLRDGDIVRALENAERVEANGLHAWNELVRALTARLVQDMGDGPSTRSIEVEAKRNISMFQATEFNICEIQTLLGKEHFDIALEIVQDEHPGFEASCE